MTGKYLLYLIPVFIIGIIAALFIVKRIRNKHKFRSANVNSELYNIDDSFLRKRKIRTYLFSIIGILLLCITISSFIIWETIGREWVLYTEIIVLNQDVQRGTEITQDLVTTAKIEQLSKIKDAVIYPEEIIGKEAKHFIPANTQLHPYYFGEPQLVIEDDQFIANIPKEWIYAFPGTLRRNDRIVFVPVSMDGYQVSARPLFETVVAYVKDSANREIRTISSEERLDASANISKIEVVVTLDDLCILENAYNQGNEFIIIYSEGDDYYADLPNIQ